MNIQCDKCGLDITYTNNFYMINNNLWEKYNNDADLLRTLNDGINKLNSNFDSKIV